MGIKRLAASVAIAGSLAAGGFAAPGTANADAYKGVRQNICAYLDKHPTVSGVVLPPISRRLPNQV